MTAKERVIAKAPGWTEDEAQRALRAVEAGGQPRDEGEQPRLTCIGMINSGRGDLSERASRDEFEPEPFR
jgi:hypothetical protein